tara:strand:+ start:1045 stop:1218 length:174 start_codon:yes stop_codon:yes gene_type:complete
MENKTLEYADKWFQLHDFRTIKNEDTIYIDFGNFEFELSKEEIQYRSELYSAYKLNK